MNIRILHLLLLTISALFVSYVHCRRSSATGPEVCNLPLKIGYGLEKKTRYYYNPSTNQCNTFTYKGMRGNSNRFRSKQECERTCVKPALSRYPSGGDRRRTLPVPSGHHATRAPYRDRTREPTTRIVYITRSTPRYGRRS